MMIQDWTISLSHLVFLSVIIYFWKCNSKITTQISSVLILLSCIWGLHWIFISLNEYGGLSYFFASLATLLLSSYVASYYLIAGVIIRKLKLGPLNIAALICLMEWTKSNLLSGFPWLNTGILQIDSIFAVFAPLLGEYGVGFFAVYFAALFAHSKRTTLTVLFLICSSGMIFNGFFNFIEPKGEKLGVVLIQGSISQNLKFDPVHEKKSHRIHIDLIKNAIEENPNSELIVLPETAFTREFKKLDPSLLAEIKLLLTKNEITLMTGIPRYHNGWKNSLISLETDKLSKINITGIYDKHHLVPFGEFIPPGFKWFVNMMEIPLGEFSKGETLQAPIKIRDHLIGVNICFEDLFGKEISKPFFNSQQKDKPSILLNISNLAWFGNSNALDYHLKASRMRSLETGRPMLRATNTGITASIGHNGQILKKLKPMESSFLNTEVQGTSGQTLYNFFGDYLILFFSLIVLFFSFFATKKVFSNPREKKLDNK